MGLATGCQVLAAVCFSFYFGLTGVETGGLRAQNSETRPAPPKTTSTHPTMNAGAVARTPTNNPPSTIKLKTITVAVRLRGFFFQFNQAIQPAASPSRAPNASGTTSTAIKADTVGSVNGPASLRSEESSYTRSPTLASSNPEASPPKSAAVLELAITHFHLAELNSETLRVDGVRSSKQWRNISGSCHRPEEQRSFSAPSCVRGEAGLHASGPPLRHPGSPQQSAVTLTLPPITSEDTGIKYGQPASPRGIPCSASSLTSRESHGSQTPREESLLRSRKRKPRTAPRT